MREYGDMQKPIEDLKSHLSKMTERTLKFEEYRKGKKEYREMLKREKDLEAKTGSIQKII